MIINYVNGKIWQGSEAPDNDVHNSLNNYPSVGDLYTDDSTGYIYICKQTGFETQVWEIVSTVPSN